MERQEFIKKLGTITGIPSRSEIRKRLAEWMVMRAEVTEKKIGEEQLVIAMEELAELQKEFSKSLRGEGTRIDIIQEMGDVLLSIYQMMVLEGISEDEVQKAFTVKYNRIMKSLDAYNDAKYKAGLKLLHEECEEGRAFQDV